jgi:mono/diheme cytochrome c family protein
MKKLATTITGILVLACGVLCGCTVERRKSDAELGLNEQQARGRRVYDQHCIRCHEPYSGREIQGPTLRGVFKKEQLPSGIKASDQRMIDVVEMGKSKMPSFRNSITEQQMQDLLAYLHTL